MSKGSQERKKIQKEIISFFDSEILPHAQWEESNLFEKVDEKRSLKNLDWIKVSR